jgi:hypothetical protein
VEERRCHDMVAKGRTSPDIVPLILETDNP